MTIIFADGKSIDCLGVHGREITYQGVNRDSLTFLFHPSVEATSLLALFQPERTEQIGLKDDESENWHANYTIYIGAGTGLKDAILGDPMNDPSIVSWITMAQTTLPEQQMLLQQKTLDSILVSMLEGE